MEWEEQSTQSLEKAMGSKVLRPKIFIPFSILLGALVTPNMSLKISIKHLWSPDTKMSFKNDNTNSIRENIMSFKL